MEYANLHIEDIIIKCLNGCATGEELATLGKWLDADPANRSYFEKHQQEWNLGSDSASALSYDSGAAFDRFTRHTGNGTARSSLSRHRIGGSRLRGSLRIVVRVAAVAMILVGVFAAYRHFRSSVLDRYAGTVNVEAPAGSRTKVMLPDGTAVWLNADSRLSYTQNFGVTNRDVTIEGEGYFEVGKQSDLQFSVRSRNMAVRDIGTKFNFRDYPEEPTAEVTLCEGEVGVKSLRHPGRETIIHPEQMTLLDKRTGRITASDCYSADKRLWTSGELVMNGMTMQQIATAISRAYKVRVVVASQRASHLQLCGTLNLDRENLDEILQTIAKAGAVTYSRNGNIVSLR